MPKLDKRLKAVAESIRCKVHADIGSDHGHLLKALLKSGRIEHGIAIENKKRPLENSRTTLAGLSADVRFADGLAGLCEREADGLSICGMGGESIAQILDAFPDRVPSNILLQPNRRPELVRQWGLRSGHHLVDERLLLGRWPYSIMRFVRSEGDEDPVYMELDQEAALLFGPHNLRRRDAPFIARLRLESRYLLNLDRLAEDSSVRLHAIQRVLSDHT